MISGKNLKKNGLLAGLIMIAALLATSCGSGSDSSGPGSAYSKNSSSFSYHYLACSNCSDGNGNCYADQSQCWGGCTTGDHNFSDAASACATLNSYSQNNGCQAYSRQQMFESLGCSGSFTNQ